ncbi:MAG: DUF6265 family protein [Flavobacteriaceae bacterium]
MKLKRVFLAVIFVATTVISLAFISKEKAIEVDEVAAFNIDDYSWLAGHWVGDGFGGISEEVWTLPADGTMMGMYRHIKDGKLVFYEFLLLDEQGLRLKHFNPDLKGWETKDEFVSFPMVSYTADKLVLKGLSFERKSDTEMEIRLRLRKGEELTTEVFQMKRK